eukprot:m.342049 g.342049  ORF g.342049 m.342049 type:complete len:792 (-) comp20846_c0_seq1:1705-4080(-)
MSFRDLEDTISIVADNVVDDGTNQDELVSPQFTGNVIHDNTVDLYTSSIEEIIGQVFNAEISTSPPRNTKTRGKKKNKKKTKKKGSPQKPSRLPTIIEEDTDFEGTSSVCETDIASVSTDENTTKQDVVIKEDEYENESTRKDVTENINEEQEDKKMVNFQSLFKGFEKIKLSIDHMNTKAKAKKKSESKKNLQSLIGKAQRKENMSEEEKPDGDEHHKEGLNKEQPEEAPFLSFLNGTSQKLNHLLTTVWSTQETNKHEEPSEKSLIDLVNQTKLKKKSNDEERVLDYLNYKKSLEENKEDVPVENNKEESVCSQASHDQLGGEKLGGILHSLFPMSKPQSSTSKDIPPSTNSASALNNTELEDKSLQDDKPIDNSTEAPLTQLIGKASMKRKKAGHKDAILREMLSDITNIRRDSTSTSNSLQAVKTIPSIEDATMSIKDSATADILRQIPSIRKTFLHSMDECDTTRAASQFRGLVLMCLLNGEEKQESIEICIQQGIFPALVEAVGTWSVYVAEHPEDFDEDETDCNLELLISLIQLTASVPSIKRVFMEVDTVTEMFEILQGNFISRVRSRCMATLVNLCLENEEAKNQLFSLDTDTFLACLNESICKDHEYEVLVTLALIRTLSIGSELRRLKLAPIIPTLTWLLSSEHKNSLKLQVASTLRAVAISDESSQIAALNDSKIMDILRSLQEPQSWGNKIFGRKCQLQQDLSYLIETLTKIHNKYAKPNADTTQVVHNVLCIKSKAREWAIQSHNNQLEKETLGLRPKEFLDEGLETQESKLEHELE